MKEFHVKLPSGDTLLKTDDPCLALMAVMRVKECRIVHTHSNMVIGVDVLDELCSERESGG